MAKKTYSNNPVLSKIKFPGSENTYWLKDNDARAILDAISDDVYESLKLALASDIADGGDNLATAGTIKAYVDQIAEIGFDVVVLQTLPTADAAAYETYHNNIVLIEDSTSKTGVYVEYVILRAAGEEAGTYIYSWEKIGTTEVDLSGYVKNVAYVDATHTLTQTKNENGVDVTTTVHQFGALADADTASTTYTPAGTIDDLIIIDSVGTLPAKDADTFDAGALPSKAADTWNAGTLPSKEADTFSAGTLPTKAADTWNAGTLPTKVADTFDAGEFPSLETPTKEQFTYEGVTVSLASTDSECLVFTAARTKDAITAQTLTQGTLPSFTEGAFTQGTLPSFTEGAFTQGTLPSFTEGAFDAGALPSFTEGAFDAGSLPTFTEGDFHAGTTPTTKTVNPVFTGTQATITVNPDPRNNNSNNGE